MDAEVLMCRRTHDIVSRCIPQTRKLMHMMCYLNDVGCNDDVFVDYKRRCGQKLSALKNKCLPKVNIAAFGLDSCNLGLYYQCVREGSMGDVRSLIEEWKRVVLGLDDAEECLRDVYDGFCKLSGYIYHRETISDVVCPLCILTDAYSDIGWTDYVCPTSEVLVSRKRGEDPDLPPACEHLMTVKKTQYDRLHSHSHTHREC